MGYIQRFIKEGRFSHFDLIFARTYVTYFGLPGEAVRRHNLWEDLEGKLCNEPPPPLSFALLSPDKDFSFAQEEQVRLRKTWASFPAFIILDCSKSSITTPKSTSCLSF